MKVIAHVDGKGRGVQGIKAEMRKTMPGRNGMRVK